MQRMVNWNTAWKIFHSDFVGVMTVAQTKNVYLEKKILNYFQYMEVVIENTGQKVNSAHSQSKNREVH